MSLHTAYLLCNTRTDRIGSGCGALRSLPVYVVLKKRCFRDSWRKTFSGLRSESFPQRGFCLLAQTDDRLKIRAPA